MSNPDTTRIFNYPEVTTPASDAKILLDSQTVGSKCIDANLFRCDLIDKTITQRGTFEASEDDADGFKKVVVDIPYTDVHVASGPIATFEGEDLPLKSLTARIVPVQAGSGDPSPTNVRPISGWTEENIIVLDDDVNKNYFYGLSKGIYGVVDLGSLSWTYSGGYFRTLSILNFKTVPQYSIANAISTIYTPKAWNSIKNTDNMCFAFPSNAGGQIIFVNTDYTDAASFKQAMQGVHLIYELAKPTAPTVTDTLLNALFEEFDTNGHATTIPFTDSQGQSVEVFGGSVDVVNGGEQPRTLGKIIIDENTTIYTGSSGMPFRVSIADIKRSTSESSLLGLLSNQMKEVTQSSTWGDECTMSVITNSDRIFFKLTNDITTVEDLKTYLEQHPIEIVYPLATPTTFYTQPTSIKSLDGENNIYANTGDVDVEYQTVWVRPTE